MVNGSCWTSIQLERLVRWPREEMGRERILGGERMRGMSRRPNKRYEGAIVMIILLSVCLCPAALSLPPSGCKPSRLRNLMCQGLQTALEQKTQPSVCM